MKALLICSGGMSTQILIAQLEKEALKAGMQIFSANAIGANEMDDYEDGFDIILVAPQIKYKFDEISEFANKKGVKVYQIDLTEYNPVGAGKLIKNLQKFMEE
ncbi:PTS sugar transporter subunit IIB [Mycoplasma hafezii]|uniref:PTS sugar transporter subunit IIB n=1 Tax=Mycoplasma hafezii TaxID=525886 RepID=UPI003CF8A215